MHDLLQRSGLLERIGEDHIYLEVDDGVEHYLSQSDAGDV
jgi:hypothetical protein